MRLFDALTEPELRGLDLDSPLRIALHRRILARKPMVRNVFADLYRLCRVLDDRFFLHTPGRRIEMGAGVSFFNQLFPDVVGTDVLPAEHLGAVIDAQQTAFRNASVRSVYALNCFHHFSDPEAFFRELIRIAHPGGGAVLVEPYYGPVASLVYGRLFASETFDKRAPGWTAGGTTGGAMRGANQAASYLVFVRDRHRFARLFPKIEIVHQRPLNNYLRYLLSGGLNFRPLVPAQAARPLEWVEALLAPWGRLLALHHVIVIRRA